MKAQIRMQILKDGLIDEDEIKEKVEVLENIVEGFKSFENEDPDDDEDANENDDDMY